MDTLEQMLAGQQDSIRRLELAHKNAVTPRAKRQITAMIKQRRKTIEIIQRQIAAAADNK
jgi:hypothetical protein